jgi:hypothetical protein
MARNRKPEERADVDEVIKLLKWMASGGVGPPPAHSADSMKAASGLAAIKQLVQREIDVFKQQPGGLAAVWALEERGLLDASDILEALTSGRDHPIFDFVKGIRARGYGQSSPPTRRELAGRLTLVGMVRAYCIAANVKPAPALRVVVEACSSENLKFTPDQIRGWEREWARCDNRDVDHAGRREASGYHGFERPRH